MEQQGYQQPSSFFFLPSFFFFFVLSFEAHAPLFPLSLGWIRIVSLERLELVIDEWWGFTVPKICFRPVFRRANKKKVPWHLR